MIRDLDSLGDVAKEILRKLPDGGVVLLVGDLASGKTTLTKAVAKELGIEEDVTSPTFSIMQNYGDKLYHYDIYMDGSDKFLESGLLENLDEEGYHFIEWADERLESLIKEMGYRSIKIEIKPKNQKREYIFYES